MPRRNITIKPALNTNKSVDMLFIIIITTSMMMMTIL